MDVLSAAFAQVFSLEILTVIFVSAVFGIFAGALPGISVTLAVALMLPITFFMSPVAALSAIATVCAVAIFAGDIPSVLLRIPGTPASAAYTDEAYEITRKGKGQQLLGAILLCSSFGGLVGALALAVMAPILADFALSFTYYEYFWLAALGLTSAAFICTNDPVKGVVSLCIGLMLAMVGFDPIFSLPRFTFGVVELFGGLNFIAALIGIFAFAEICRVYVKGGVSAHVNARADTGVFTGVPAMLWRYKGHLARGPAIGTTIGALPGAGSDVAAWIAYALSRKASRTPERYGTGHPEGVIAAASANNAAACGTWIPSLVFGIPGDSVTAIVIGVFYLKGLQPGPMVFLNESVLIYSIFIAFFVANILMIPAGFVAIKAARQITRVPQIELMSVVLLFCIVGSFAINNTAFGVLLMLTLGLLAFIMQENDFPVAPIILGMIMAPLLEESFMQGMILGNGSMLAFVSRPIAALLALVTILIVAWPVLRLLYHRLGARGGAGRPA